MYLFEINYEEIKDNKITKINLYVVAKNFDDVYEKERNHISKIANRELIGIVRHVPIAMISDEK
jgi:hypothetical protein